MRIYHLINPYRTEDGSESKRIQLKTLESIHNALEYAKDVIDVHVIVKVDPEEYEYYKNMFSNQRYSLGILTKTSRDLNRDFHVPRKFPLLDDLINISELVPKSDFDANADTYVVFTNMDICLQPYFYTEVARIIAQGTDAFVINRRTIDKSLLDRPLTESYTAKGDRHIGHDCFVIKISHLQKFRIRQHILGIGFVFRPLLLNCIIHSRRFKEFDDVYLTFHYGDDMDWKDPKFDDYMEYNRELLIESYKDHLNEVPSIPDNKKPWMKKFFSFSFLPKVD